ncbi:hypothetical protein VTK73DRAFT_3441 [Phialemonium thermophilum]|uniref:Uncharacterized protein n=1 Tax=Phialemonium thermophilum TaxID=223376 RepID=A0ABR3VI83_9PEZI
MDTPTTPATWRRDWSARDFSRAPRTLRPSGRMSSVLCRSIRTVSLPGGPCVAITTNAYLTVTIRVRLQTMMERAPTRSSHEGCDEKVDE